MKAVSIAHIPIKRLASSLQKFSSKRSVKVKTKFLTWSNERYMIAIRKNVSLIYKFLSERGLEVSYIERFTERRWLLC